jgi:ADP-ribose pyrophosphatase
MNRGIDLNNFKLKSSKEIYKGRIIDLRVDEIQNENGTSGIREVVSHPGGAAVVAVRDGKIILVSQFRYPLNQIIYELPAGKLDLPEDPLVCAQRELEEETGYVSNNFIKLGEIVSTPGFCNERLHLFLANHLKSGTKNHDEGEVGMETHFFTLGEIEEKISSGEIIDAKTICAIYLVKKYLDKQS